ncbi:TPA: hypothetical protein I7730_01425 [Vibrio vulnificus]|uniref:Uncharacterized protein n=1 Tax=Vibrio vulnificus TaxID=672 RepID=A0A8H9K7A7_VIBVL|nr:hypothetical protein [Vibrio vulnificus]HAS8538457.1 hypothetical protein [Vibrio vulnificus]
MRILSIFTPLLLLSSNAFGFQSGNYPQLAIAPYQNSSIASSNNVISSAIESGETISLNYDSSFKSYLKTLFSYKNYGSYMSGKLSNESVSIALQQLVGEFACAQYRFRHRMPEANECNGIVADDENIEKMPLVDGQFKDMPLEVNVDNEVARVGYRFVLKTDSEYPLESALGSVHELGTFFGGHFNSRQLQLRVVVYSYKLDEALFRQNEPIYESGSSIFVILPTASEIYNQDSELLARDFVIKSAKILLN